MSRNAEVTGTGRRAGLRSPWGASPVWVRLPPSAPSPKWLELVDAADSNSVPPRGVWVRLPLWALKIGNGSVGQVVGPTDCKSVVERPWRFDSSRSHRGSPGLTREGPRDPPLDSWPRGLWHPFRKRAGGDEPPRRFDSCRIRRYPLEKWLSGLRWAPAKGLGGVIHSPKGSNPFFSARNGNRTRYDSLSIGVIPMEVHGAKPTA